MRTRTSRFVQRLLVAGTVFAGSTGWGAELDGARLGESPLTLPVRIVDGHLIVAVTLRDRNGASDPVSLELTLDNPDVLTLHGDQLRWLKIDSAAARRGEEVLVTVSFGPGTEVLVPAGSIRPEESRERAGAQDRLTRLSSGALHDRRVKGCIGLGFLRPYQVVLDLRAGQLELTPLAGAPTGIGASVGADINVPFELREGLLTLPLASPAGPARLVLGSTRYDTLIDAAIASKLGRPAGDVAPVELLGETPLDLAELVAFRPREWGAQEGSGTLLVSGVNLLKALRLEIDWLESVVRLTRQEEAGPAAADRAFFQAEQANNPDAYASFLARYPTARLGPEAARKLLDLRVEQWGVADEDLLQAVRWVINTSPPERRTENGAQAVRRLMDMLGRVEVTVAAAHLALEHSRRAITVQETYRLHRILGEQYLLLDDLSAAWKHFLAASFVTLHREPEHTFLCALGLARVYERQDRPTRAYSRYRAALASGFRISPALKEEIDAALARLRMQIPADKLEMLED